MHVVDMVFYWAKVAPSRAAILQPEMVTTFAGLADTIESICDRIDRLGLDRREPVAVSLANPAFFIATAFALMRSGYSVALANPPLFPLLMPAGIKTLFYDAQGLVLSGARNIRFEKSWLPDAAAPRSGKPYRQRPVGDVDLIVFTSGTTGLPKMFVQKKDSWEMRITSPLASCAFGEHRNALIMAGLAGAFGFYRTCEMLYVGKTAGFAPSVEAGLWLINVFNLESVIASTQQALALAEIQQTKTHDPLTSLKTLFVGGAAIPPEVGKKLRSHVCRSITVRYGSTEAGTAAAAPYDAIADIPDAVGYIVPSATVEIVDEEGNVLPLGTEGFVRISTTQYVQNLEQSGDHGPTQKSDQWFTPGDVGRITDNGVLCVTGRSSDVINAGGVKLSAKRIEEILESYPEIKEAAACGVKGPSGLVEVWIAIVPRAPVDSEDIKKRLRENGEVNFPAHQVFQVENLPRGDLGKVQKYKLIETLTGMARGT